jgi:hypothetical protein
MSPEAGWLLVDQIVPRLRAVIPRSVLTVGAEDPEELIQDATCLAGRILHNAEAQGKHITHGNAAYYALQHCKSGRRSVGHSSSDVHGTATQLYGRSRLESMEQVVAEDQEGGGEIFELHDVLADDHDDPGTKAARNLDWEAFLASLSSKDQKVVLLMVEGKCGSAIARALRTTDSRIQTIKRHLAKALLEFMGPEILKEIQRWPRWKNDILATRERLACKHTRSH